MKVVFLCADKERESLLADAFLAGVAKWGDEVEKVYKSPKDELGDGDVFCVVGVKSAKLFRKIKDAGKHVVFFDKGYFRHRGPGRTWEYWRVSLDEHHPTDYVAVAKHRPARWEYISRRRVPDSFAWRDGGGHIVYAGSSEKYHSFVGIEEPTAYAASIIKRLKKLTNRLVVYRPKPTWMAAEPVKGANYSPRNESIGDVLKGAWCLVTNGSNASFDAVLAGIPCIVLGKAIARPISSTTLDDIENPRLATDDERTQWLSNIAWCMFTEKEMQEGLAWQCIRPQIEGGMLDDSELNVVAFRGMKPAKGVLKSHGAAEKDKKKASKAENKHTKQQRKLTKHEKRNSLAVLPPSPGGLEEAPQGEQDVFGEIPAQALRPDKEADRTRSD